MGEPADLASSCLVSGRRVAVGRLEHRLENLDLLDRAGRDEAEVLARNLVGKLCLCCGDNVARFAELQGSVDCDVAAEGLCGV